MKTRNPERPKQEGSQPQRSRQHLTQTKQSPPRVTKQSPPRMPVDTFIFSYCRGPRMIQDRGGCNGNNNIVGSTTTTTSNGSEFQNHDDYQYTTISEITSITKTRCRLRVRNYDRTSFPTRNYTVVCSQTRKSHNTT